MWFLLHRFDRGGSVGRIFILFYTIIFFFLVEFLLSLICKTDKNEQTDSWKVHKFLDFAPT